MTKRILTMKQSRTGFIFLLLLLGLVFVFALGFDAPAPTGAAPAVAGLSIQPASLTVVAGQVFTVSLSIAGVTNAGGYEATIFYDPSHLQAQAVTHPTPRFLAVNGRSAGTPPDDPLIDAALVRITTAEYSYAAGNPAGASGSGVLALIRFKALAVGTSQVTLSSEVLYPVQLLDINGASLTFTSVGGSVNIIAPFNMFLPVIRL